MEIQTTMPSPELSTPQLQGGRLAMRVCMMGTLLASVLLLLALLCLPARILPAELHSYLGLGVLVAVIVGAIGSTMLSLASCQPASNPQNGTAFLRAVVLEFALQFITIIVALLGMNFAGVKFPALAAFGIAYAAVAMVFRASSSIMISRALSQRARQRSATKNSSI